MLEKLIGCCFFLFHSSICRVSLPLAGNFSIAWSITYQCSNDDKIICHYRVISSISNENEAFNANGCGAEIAKNCQLFCHRVWQHTNHRYMTELFIILCNDSLHIANTKHEYRDTEKKRRKKKRKKTVQVNKFCMKGKTLIFIND